MALTQWQLKPVATETTIASGDFLAFTDESETGDPINKITIDNLATFLAGGSNLSASSGVLSATDTNTTYTATTNGGIGLSGTAFSLDIDGMTDIGAGIASGDLLIIDDSGNGTNRKTTVDRLATLFAGTGLTASSGVISVDAAQTGITSVGTIGTGTWQGTAIASAYIADDAVTLAKMASGRDGNIISYDASGDPVAIATGNDGQVLTSTGAGSPPAFEDVPGGGITRAEQWRLHTALASNAQGSILIENWELDDTDGHGSISAGMSLSSGVFTFPETGIWQIEVSALFGGTGGAGAVDIQTTLDNSSYSTVSASGFSSIITNITGGTAHAVYLFDVTNTSNDKVKFTMGTFYSSGQMNGSTTANYSTVVFTRLGDT